MFWTPDGEFVDVEGHAFRGRAAIAKELAAFFAEAKGVTLEISSDSLRFVSPGVALETGTAQRHAAPPTGRPAPPLTRSCMPRRTASGRWRVWRETPYTPTSNYEHLRDLEWMVGNWRSVNGAQVLDLNCEWTGKRNFLTRSFNVKNAEGAISNGLQIIAWDPVVGGIRSWVFDSDGGIGAERWTRDGKRWVMEATGATRDGAQTSAVNILTPLDHDSFTWQSIRRSVNQVRLDDLGPVKVVRLISR